MSDPTKIKSENNQLIVVKGPDKVETFIDNYFSQKALYDYSVIITSVVIGYLFLLTVKKTLLSRLKKFAKETPNWADDAVLTFLESTLRLTLFALSLRIALCIKPVSKDPYSIIVTSFNLIILFQVAKWATSIFKVILESFIGSKSENSEAAKNVQSALVLLEFFGIAVIWSLVTLATFSNLGFNISALLTGLGVGGVAVALAVQTVLSDLFASLSIVLDKPFIVGDFIILSPDMMGTVERIGIKTTRIRSLSGEELVLSNSDLINSRIKNYKRMFERRVVEKVGVTYDTTYEQLEKVSEYIKDIITRENKVKFDRSHFSSYGDSALVIEYVYIVLSPDYNLFMDIKQKINLAIHKKFTDEGLQFAFPTQTIYLKQEN